MNKGTKYGILAALAALSGGMQGYNRKVEQEKEEAAKNYTTQSMGATGLPDPVTGRAFSPGTKVPWSTVGALAGSESRLAGIDKQEAGRSTRQEKGLTFEGTKVDKTLKSRETIAAGNVAGTAERAKRREALERELAQLKEEGATDREVLRGGTALEVAGGHDDATLAAAGIKAESAGLDRNARASQHAAALKNAMTIATNRDVTSRANNAATVQQMRDASILRAKQAMMENDMDGVKAEMGLHRMLAELFSEANRAQATTIAGTQLPIAEQQAGVTGAAAQLLSRGKESLKKAGPAREEFRKAIPTQRAPLPYLGSPPPQPAAIPDSTRGAPGLPPPVLQVGQPQGDPEFVRERQAIDKILAAWNTYPPEKQARLMPKLEAARRKGHGFDLPR